MKKDMLVIEKENGNDNDDGSVTYTTAMTIATRTGESKKVTVRVTKKERGGLSAAATKTSEGCSDTKICRNY